MALNTSRSAGSDWVIALRELAMPVGTDTSAAELVDEIAALEAMRGAVAARQARVTAALVAKRRAEQAALGVPAERVGRGIAAEVGLARRISPHHAARYVGQVTTLTSELPESFRRMARGEAPEWRVLLVARETAWLSREHRLAVDQHIARVIGRLGTRKTVDTVRKLAYELDPRGYVQRLRQVESERHVSLRPAPDCMATLTALLPMQQGVAAFAALRVHADQQVGVGDETRTRSQLMADALVERLTGQASAADVPVAVNLVMTDRTLVSAGHEPAHLVGGGAIPAELARRMVLDPSGETAVLVRRLYLDSSGRLAGMDSASRLFTANQRAFLVLRDQTCRTPWCDAPVRHADHVVPAEDGGPTSIDNGQGLCESCNHAKQAPGWRHEVDGDEIVTVTPTGHRYRSRAPDPPGGQEHARRTFAPAA